MNTTPMTKPRGPDTLMEDLENAVHAADAGQARDVLAEMGPLGARVGRYLSAKGAKGLEACVSLDEQAPNLLKISPLLGPSAAITLASALDIPRPKSAGNSSGTLEAPTTRASSRPSPQSPRP